MKQKHITDTVKRWAELMIAILFLVTAAVSIPAAFLFDPILKESNYLTGIVSNKSVFVLGALLRSINNIGIVFIAVFIYPLLKKLNETAAAGYLALRIIEGMVMMLGIAATLMLVLLSYEFIMAGFPPNSWYQTLGDSIMQATFMGLTLVSLSLLGLGGCIITSQLFRFRLVPLFSSVVGLIGYSMILNGGLATLFGVINPSSSPGCFGVLLAIPVPLFEITHLPNRLFRGGFKMPKATETIV